MANPLAHEIVDVYIRDLTGRSGFDGLWDSLDEDIRIEVRSDLIDKVEEVLNMGGGTGG